MRVKLHSRRRNHHPIHTAQQAVTTDPINPAISKAYQPNVLILSEPRGTNGWRPLPE